MSNKGENLYDLWLLGVFHVTWADGNDHCKGKIFQIFSFFQLTICGVLTTDVTF